jgi:putative transcriptional regulator
MSWTGGGRNWKRWLAITGIAAAIWSIGIVTASADEELGEGTILIADKNLSDPNFQKTVVLLMMYDDHGAVGLVLNRQSDIQVSQLLPGVKEARDRTDTAFTGGPVEPKSVLALLRSNKAPDGAQHIVGDIWAILDQDLLQDTMTSHPGPDKLRFYLGYAGWGPGQLEAETDAGAWRVIRANATTVFDASPESLWDRVVQSLDLRLARAANPNAWGPKAPRGLLKN